LTEILAHHIGTLSCDMGRLLFFVATLAVLAEGVNHTVIVTGATGRTGSATYLDLKKAGINVRGLVRNITKARELLGCSKCDESEGIFVGDITKEETMRPAMVGADALVILTAPAETKGGMKLARDIMFDGVANQVAAFLGSPGPEPQDRHILLQSMQYTTLPDTVINKLIAHLWGGWDVGFYSLQGEAHVMSAGASFTILKACGLGDDPAMQSHVLIGHDDKGWRMKDVHTVSRHDCARVLAAAAANPSMSKGLRFDMCSSKGTAQETMELIKDAMQPWDPRKIPITVV